MKSLIADAYLLEQNDKIYKLQYNFNLCVVIYLV